MQIARDHAGRGIGLRLDRPDIVDAAQAAVAKDRLDTIGHLFNRNRRAALRDDLNVSDIRHVQTLSLWRARQDRDEIVILAIDANLLARIIARQSLSQIRTAYTRAPAFNLGIDRLNRGHALAPIVLDCDRPAIRVVNLLRLSRQLAQDIRVRPREGCLDFRAAPRPQNEAPDLALRSCEIVIDIALHLRDESVEPAIIVQLHQQLAISGIAALKAVYQHVAHCALANERVNILDPFKRPDILGQLEHIRVGLRDIRAFGQPVIDHHLRRG